MSSTSAGGSGATHGAKCVIKLFDSKLLASNIEATLLEWPRKCPRGSSVPKDAPKSSSAKGICRRFFTNYEYYTLPFSCRQSGGGFCHL
jgi:hypothetical protein